MVGALFVYSERDPVSDVEHGIAGGTLYPFHKQGDRVKEEA